MTVPEKTTQQIVNPWSRSGSDDYGKWFIAGNVVEGNAAVTAYNWNGGIYPQDGTEFLAGLRLAAPWPSMPINQQTAEEAFKLVLDHAGAVLPKRDPVDVGIIDEVRNGYATYEGEAYEREHRVADPLKKSGIIDRLADVGGWPQLQSAPAQADSDHDGMPDEWEQRNKSQPERSDRPERRRRRRLHDDREVSEQHGLKAGTTAGASFVRSCRRIVRRVRTQPRGGDREASLPEDGKDAVTKTQRIDTG